MSYRKNVEKAYKARHKIVDAIYALAPNNATPFSECRKLASPELRQAYDEAVSAEVAAEYAAINAGKAYRSSTGGLIFTR